MKKLLPFMFVLGVAFLPNGQRETSTVGCNCMEAIAKKPPRNTNLDVHQIIAIIPV